MEPLFHSACAGRVIGVLEKCGSGVYEIKVPREPNSLLQISSRLPELIIQPQRLDQAIPVEADDVNIVLLDFTATIADNKYCLYFRRHVPELRFVP